MHSGMEKGRTEERAKAASSRLNGIDQGEPGWLRWMVLGLLVICGTLLLFYRLGQLALWESDEARFALKALMMRETGNWLIPIRKGQAWLHKPPLQMWLINLVALSGGGINELTARIPSALAAMGTLLLTYWWGRRLGGTLFGGLAGFILLTSGHFLLMGRYNLPEQVMVFFTTLALVAFYAGYHKWLGGWIWYVMYAALGLATLTKGPVGLLLPALVILAYLAIQRDLGALRHMRCPSGLLLSAGIILPWYLAVSLGYGQSVQPALFGEIIKALLASRGHAEPWYFYLWTVPLSLAPWSLFLPGLYPLWRWCRKRERTLPDGLRFAGVWGLTVLLAFSVAGQKRSYYSLPLFPAAAIMVAHVWDFLVESGRSAVRWFRRYLLGVMVILLLLAILLTVAVALEGLGVSKGMIEVKRPAYAALFLAPIFLPLLLAVVSVRRGEYVWAFAVFTVAWMWFFLFAIRFHAPARDKWTARNVGTTLRQIVSDRRAVWGYGLYSDGISFYFGYDIPPLRDFQEVDHRLKGGSPVYLLTDRGLVPGVLAQYPGVMHGCRDFYYRKRDMRLVLLTNQKCPEEGLGVSK
ncbi:MAG: ArnT family glycosyltransferase [Candidatus Methylomirabilales bacterium]